MFFSPLFLESQKLWIANLCKSCLCCNYGKLHFCILKIIKIECRYTYIYSYYSKEKKRVSLKNCKSFLKVSICSYFVTRYIIQLNLDVIIDITYLAHMYKKSSKSIIGDRARCSRIFLTFLIFYHFSPYMLRFCYKCIWCFISDSYVHEDPCLHKFEFVLNNFIIILFLHIFHYITKMRNIFEITMFHIRNFKI